MKKNGTKEEISLLQKRIIHPKIMYQEYDKMSKVLGVLGNACMNFQNPKHNLFKIQVMN